jgi:hemoglobin-like flavoprotein
MELWNNELRECRNVVKGTEEGRSLLQEEDQQEAKTIVEKSNKIAEAAKNIEAAQELEVSIAMIESRMNNTESMRRDTVHATHLYVSTLKKVLQRTEGLDDGAAWTKAIDEMESKVQAETVNLYRNWMEKSEDDKWDKDGRPII